MTSPIRKLTRKLQHKWIAKKTTELRPLGKGGVIAERLCRYQDSMVRTRYWRALKETGRDIIRKMRKSKPGISLS